MMKRILILTVALSIALTSALGQQECDVLPESPVLKYYYGRLTLEHGDGELFCLGGGPDAEKQGYSRIYYLFTNAPKVYISSDYYGKGIAIHYQDNTSQWFIGDSLYENSVISYPKIRTSTNLGFLWDNRARILFDTKNNKNTDPNHTVALIVLPVPPRDTLFTSLKLTNKHIKKGILTANLEIGRTGRIVFDSIWIDSVPQQNVTYNGSNRRDTPYYRYHPHANIEIDKPVSRTQKNITVTVFYRFLNPDGNSIISKVEVRSVPIRMGFPLMHIAIVVALIVILFLFLRWIVRKRKREKPQRDARHTENHRLKSQIDKQKKRIVSLESQLKDMNAQLNKEREESFKEIGNREKVVHDLNVQLRDKNAKINKLEEALREAQNKEYTAEDSAEFRHRCNMVVNEIDVLYNKLIENGDDMPTRVVAEKVRQLEKLICIKQRK